MFNRPIAVASGILVVLSLVNLCGAQVCNLKVLTDASPDYSDMDSMVRSITARWDKPADKCWAIYYWNHIARRQTMPMQRHGLALTDPIRQFNDYGHAMCSTISGINCSIWDHMGLRAKYWDISNHTVCEVEFDGTFHMFDNSLSALYTTCDGKTLAGVAEIGADGACEASGGKVEPGHIARYHCLYATSPNGFLQGADTPRSVAEEYRCFKPSGLKYRNYFYDWDRGHRYILNVRLGESYTRHFIRPDGGDKPRASGKDYKCDARYYVPNGPKRIDPESVNPRYGLRGNGEWTYRPPLKDASIAKHLWGESNVACGADGLCPKEAGKPAWAIFKINGANVITSQRVRARFSLQAGQSARLLVSTTNGMQWKEVWKSPGDGEVDADVQLIEEVNGAYEVLLKAELEAPTVPKGCLLSDMDVQTITQLNAKTQPRLNVGRNTVYVGAGEQLDATVYWPELQAGRYRPLIVEEKNVKVLDEHPGYYSVLCQAKPGEAYVVFKMDLPADAARLVYGGRLYPRAPKCEIEFLHSLDGGKTWISGHKQATVPPPWDVIRYVTVNDIPAGVRSVLFKYRLDGPNAGATSCGLYAVRMEAQHRPLAPCERPVAVTYAWQERQEDYSLVRRSHTEIASKLPHKYTINVGGADHPVMESLQVRVLGEGEAPPKAGYSDGKDVGGEKFVGAWETIGKNLAEGKPYTSSAQSLTQWGAGDPEGKKLTDGVVAANYAGGTMPGFCAMWHEKQTPEIVVDLGKAQSCGAFRIHLTAGWPWWDAIQGEVRDEVEVLTSSDGQSYASQGKFDFRLRHKDIPVNFMFADDEKAQGWNFCLAPPKAVQARYVKYKITPKRTVAVSEVQVLDSYRREPFDLRLDNDLTR